MDTVPGNASVALTVLAHCLTQVASAMAAAAQGAGSSGGKAAAERAANDVFEANLDTVVAMGWANVERYCLDNFRKVRRKSFRPRGWALPGGMVHRLTASAR